MQTPMIEDTTWAQLDPLAGTFTPRQRARAFFAVLATALVVVLVWLVWWSGLLSPRLALEDRSEGSPGQVIGSTRTFRYSVALVNPAPHGVEIVSVGRSGPGLKLVSVTGAHSPLPGSSSELVDLTYEVTDCSAVIQDEWPIPVTVRRRGGSGVLLLSAPLIDPFWLDRPASESALGDSSIGDLTAGLTDDLGGEPWQSALAGQVCTAPDRAGDQ